MSGNKKVAMLVVGAALIVAAFAMPSPAQIQPMTADRPSAEVLPESTIFMFEMRDIGATGERATESALYKVLSNPDFQDYFSPILVYLEDAIEAIDNELQQNLDVTLAELGGLFDGRLTLAVTDLSIFPNPGVNVVLMLTPSDTEHMGNMLDRLIPEDLKLMAVARTLHNVEMFQVGQGAEAFGWAVPDNTLVFGYGQGAVAGVLNRMAGDGNSLVDKGLYSAIYEKVAEYDGDWLFFLNLESPLMILRALGGAQAAGAIHQLGVDNIQGLAIAGKLDGDSVEDLLYLHMPGEARGFADLISPESVNMELVKLIPADAFGFSITRFNPALLYDFVLDVVRVVEQDAYDEMMEAIAEFEEEMDIDIRDGFLGALGAELIIYELPRPIDELKELMNAAETAKERELVMHLVNHGYSIYMMTVEDPERLSASMDIITDAILEPIKEIGEMQRAMVEEFQADPDLQDMEWGSGFIFIDTVDLEYATETYGGFTIKYLPGLPVEELVPAYVVTDDAIIFSAKLETLRKAIDMEAGGENITGAEMWAEARNMIPEEIGGFSVSRSDDSVEMLSIMLESFLKGDAAALLGELGEEMADQDPAPMIEVLKQHAPVQVSYMRTIPGQGVELFGRSISGASSMVPAIVVGIAGGSAYYTYTMMRAFEGGMMMEPGMGDDWDF